MLQKGLNKEILYIMIIMQEVLWNIQHSSLFDEMEI